MDQDTNVHSDTCADFKKQMLDLLTRTTDLSEFLLYLKKAQFLKHPIEDCQECSNFVIEFYIFIGSLLVAEIKNYSLKQQLIDFWTNKLTHQSNN